MHSSLSRADGLFDHMTDQDMQIYNFHKQKCHRSLPLLNGLNQSVFKNSSAESVQLMKKIIASHQSKLRHDDLESEERSKLQNKIRSLEATIARLK